MNVVVTDEQGLHRAEVFSAPYTVPTEQAGGAQGMGERTLLHQLTTGIFHTIWGHALQ